MVNILLIALTSIEKIAGALFTSIPGFPTKHVMITLSLSYHNVLITKSKVAIFTKSSNV